VGKGPIGSATNGFIIIVILLKIFINFYSLTCKRTLRDNKAVISFESECSIRKHFKKSPKERIKSKKGNFYSGNEERREGRGRASYCQLSGK
jgi:hypothetical protein